MVTMGRLTRLHERIVTTNGRNCPKCGYPVDHFGPTVELPADGSDVLVCRTDEHAYVHRLGGG